MRIIIIGGAASGKNHLKQTFIDKGLKHEISYTSRAPREGEVEGIDYFFISKERFKLLVDSNLFVQWNELGSNYYGTLRSEFESKELFIMSANGIQQLNVEDRVKVFTIYLDIDRDIKYARLCKRGIDHDIAIKRLDDDKKEFDSLRKCDFDLHITNQNF